ncbi:MAG: plasmid pRiA4b ORF-3 family protein [Caldilineaceae bacterium]|nr:plasmid pRiA4b ORF-3 family protein [Caldilineaceae bacterium]
MARSRRNAQLMNRLRNTPITEESPGLLLHDFQTLLDFAEQNALPLTGMHVLPTRTLRVLNEQLQRRIEHGLTRPQQKSFPHINGLFLLLRASGLTTVNALGDKPILEVDPAMRHSWDQLNPDERYFALLESWLIRGDPIIIGNEQRGFYLNPPLRQWNSFFMHLEEGRWSEDDWIERTRYYPGLYNLALMELFGLIMIEDDSPVEKAGWRIRDVQATQWGEVLLTALRPRLVEDWSLWEQLQQPALVAPGVLQPIIGPYRPAYRTVFAPSDHEHQSGLFVFKVMLSSTLWRRIAIGGDRLLEDLSDAILAAYNFDHDHLYRFLYPTRFGTEAEVAHPYIEEAPRHTTDVQIGDLPAQPGFQMIYHYDFGDDWRFSLVLERIEPQEEMQERYKIIEREGESPEQYSYW